MLNKADLYTHYTEVEAPLMEALAVADADTQTAGWQAVGDRKHAEGQGPLSVFNAQPQPQPQQQNCIGLMLSPHHFSGEKISLSLSLSSSNVHA